MNATLDFGYKFKDHIGVVNALFLMFLVMLIRDQNPIYLSEHKEMVVDIQLSASPQPSPPPEPPLIPPSHRPTPAKSQPMPIQPAEPTPSLWPDGEATTPVSSSSLSNITSAPDTNRVASHSPAVTPAEPSKTSSDKKLEPTSLDHDYLSQLVAYLEKIKRYPSSREARQSRPEGTVQLWLELNRLGQLLAVGVVNSSGFNLLDQEALKTVRTGQFPAMPESAFSGQTSHRFHVQLRYELNSK